LRASKGRAPRRHFVENDTQSEHIRARVGTAALNLFGGHVRQGSEHDTFIGQLQALGGLSHFLVVLSIPELCQTKVEELHAAGRQHDVARLEVAMNHALAVCSVERLRDLDRDDEGSVEGDGTERETLCQRFAVEHLHDKEGHTILLADVVESTDVRVTHAGDRPRLTLEAIELAGSTARADVRILIATARSRRGSRA
jgi:hypothetical protein